MSENELQFYKADIDKVIEIPMSDVGVSAGFPSPADDYIDLKLDLNRELIRNPSSTFFVRVSGVSMIDEGIDDGDLLIVDKSVEPFQGCLAVCFIDGDFTLKRVKFESDCAWLVPANKNYKPIRVAEGNDFMIWGIVRYVIKKI